MKLRMKSESPPEETAAATEGVTVELASDAEESSGGTRASRTAVTVMAILAGISVLAFLGVVAMQVSEYLSYGQAPSVW